MESAEFFWAWLNGLVRRAAIGVLAYFLFAIIGALTVLSATARYHELERLDGYSREHAKLVGAFADIGAHATDLAGAKKRAGAMSAIQPLRESLVAARKADLPSLACANSWLEGLRNLQTIPAKVVASCPAGKNTCEVPRDKLLLDDLLAFEKGIASAQDMLKTFDALCFSNDARDEFCGYYLRHREKEVADLGGMVGSYYREKPPVHTALDRFAAKAPVCEADRTFLTSARYLEADIDATARPRTLADFESLGAAIAAKRVAKQTEDTRISSAPAGGFLTVLVPKDVSLPVLNFLGLGSIIYAFLQLRRLRSLSKSHTLETEKLLYRLYPIASHAFTAPVFGVDGEPAASDRSTRISTALTIGLFSKIPEVSCGIAGLAVAGAVVLLRIGANEFSFIGVVPSVALFLLQFAGVRAYRIERAALQNQFDHWVVDHPVADIDQVTAGEGKQP